MQALHDPAAEAPVELQAESKRQPVYFLSHGGGPWPWLTGPMRDGMNHLEESLQRLPGELPEQPKAILMVSSYLPELLGVCDRVAVMCRGVLGPPRRVDEVDEHQIMLEATGAA